MDWAHDGQLVDARINGRRIRCVVASAMGDTARVINSLHGIDTWVSVHDLKEVEKQEITFSPTPRL